MYITGIYYTYFLLVKIYQKFLSHIDGKPSFFKDDLVFLKFVRLAHIRCVFGLQETPFIYHPSYQLCKFLKEAQIKCGGIFFLYLHPIMVSKKY